MACPVCNRYDCAHVRGLGLLPKDSDFYLLSAGEVEQLLEYGALLALSRMGKDGAATVEAEYEAAMESHKLSDAGKRLLTRHYSIAKESWCK